MTLERAHIPSRHLTQTRGLFIAACFGLITLGVVAGWFISADPSGTAPSIESFFSFMVSPWMLATHAIAVAFMSFGLWLLGTRVPQLRATERIEQERGQYGRLLALVLVLFSVSLAVVGTLFVENLRVTFRTQQFEQQEGFARLKAQQVDKWILDRSLDTQTLAQSLRTLPLDRLAGDRESRQYVRLLFGESLAGNADRSSLALFAADGTLVLDVGGAAESDASLRTHVRELQARGERGLSIVDVHPRPGSASALAMDFVLPIRSGGDGPVPVLVLTADPGRELFGQIATWPTAGRGSEMLLVRRDGDNLQLLTPSALPGRTPPPPLSVRLPLARAELPGVQAIRKGDGARGGSDERGTKVYSASHHVTGAPWQVVAKTDVAEVMRPWREKAIMVAAVIGAAILAAAFMVFVLWRGLRAAYQILRDAQIQERTALSKHFEELVRLARDPVFLIDPDGRFVDCNEAAVTTYGYTAEEFRSLSIRDVRTPEAQADIDRQYQGAAAPAGVLFETVHRRRDGTTFPVEVSSRAIDVDGVRYRQSFVRDVSRRRELEGELQRMSRVQKALRAANSILLRAKSEFALFQGMCDVIVHMGGYRMAFVGVANQDAARSVGFLASAGSDTDFVKSAQLSWGDGPNGEGPTGMALKTGRIQVQQDFARNPRVAHWRKAAVAENFQSGIALPLTVAGTVTGVLTIYSALPDAFDAEEVELLTEFAADLSYGMGVLRGRAAD